MTLFSKIIAGEIPSYKIAEDDNFFAFLDIFPSTLGHTLVVPKIEIDKLFELPADYLSNILIFAQPIANAIKKTYHCERVNILTLGFDVPHTHIHLLPMNSMKDFDLNKKLQLTPEELKEVQGKIISNL
jgi:Diadenosine tetraphosphate (Ap4A) hydrolase and other HIT family hydrolases